MDSDLKNAMDCSRSARAKLPAVFDAERTISQMGDWQWEKLQKKLKANPNDGWLHLWSGLVLARRNNHRDAMTAFSSAVAKGCSHWRAGWYIAQSAAKTGDLAVVDQACQMVLKLAPEFWYAREFPRHARGYYAQMDQDKVIEKFFADYSPRAKVFVEVGAFDGVHYSNVRRLHEHYGWTGVCVEPVAKNFEKLARSYEGKHVKCVRAAISGTEGELEMNVSTYPHLPDWGSDVASISNEDTERWRRQYSAVWTKEKVATKRLTTILEEAAIEDFDLLSVDAEGVDLEVLKTLDFSRFQPQLIVVEYGKEKAAIAEFLAGKGYSLLADNGQDLIMQRPASALKTSVKPKRDGVSTNSMGESAPDAAQGKELSAAELGQMLEMLNPHLLSLKTLPTDRPVRIGSADAIALLSAARFDIPAKTIYARCRRLGIQSEWGSELYRQHIEAFTRGTCVEGDGFKHNIQDYFTQFNELLDGFAEKGFDPQRSLIPIGRNFTPVDGAHRVAAGIVYSQPVHFLAFDFNANAYSSGFFKNRGLTAQACDAMALEYATLSLKSYVVTLFPAAQGREKEVAGILRAHGEIVYQKEVQLSKAGSFNLIRQMYAGEPWLGNWKNRFAGAWGKANPCFAKDGPVRVYLLDARDLEQVKAAKQEIRELFGIGNHSVHINDTHEQSVQLAQLFFNENSLHFLNSAEPKFFERFEKQLEMYRAWLRRSGADLEHFCIDGSAVMAAYGIRESADLDVLHFCDADFSRLAPAVNSHNRDAHHHVMSRDEIIFNPANHFYFNGLKFVSLEVLRQMKAKRNEGKDRRDVAAMDILLNGAKISEYAFSNSWFSVHEKYWNEHLVAWGKKRQSLEILEIGSYEGRSACWFLNHLCGNSKSRLTCIDPWEQSTTIRVYEESMEGVFQRFQKNVLATGRGAQVNAIRGKSSEKLPTFAPASFDLIYVDGDHSEQAAYADTIEAFRLVRDGGMILWDDYDCSAAVKAGVDRACLETGIRLVRFGQNASFQKPSRAAGSNMASAKIVALLPARNEAARLPFCLRTLARYTDAIVYLDDCSDDNSVEVVRSLAQECRVERIIAKSKWHRDEPGDRNALLKAGRELGGTHFIVLDADEAFTGNCSENGFLRRHLLSLRPGERLVMTWIQLWRSVETYRFDNSVWTHNLKAFAFCDDGVCSYDSRFIHTPRTPQNLKGKSVTVGGYVHGVLHFQFVNWRNLQIKQAWYRCLERVRDAKRPSAKINELYAPSEDESGLHLQKCPPDWLTPYPFFDAEIFNAADSRRLREVRGWFKQFGRDHFRDLDIWRVDWDAEEAIVAGETEIEQVRSNRVEASLLTLPAEVQGLLDTATDSFAKSDCEGARHSLARALEFVPDHPEILAAYGGVAFQLSDFSDAREKFERAVTIAPNARAFTQLAVTCLKLEDVNAFEDALGKALQLDPECIEALRLLADLNQEAGEHARAATAYQRIVKQTPGDLQVRLLLGQALANGGELAGAATVFKEVLELDPLNATAREFMALIAQKVSQETVATQKAERSVVEKDDRGEKRSVSARSGKPPLVSAIVSTYKSERFLRGCLEDLEAQTIADRIEIIVVDSNSPEKEKAIVQEFQQRYSNIVYIRTEERETVYGAWNRAIKVARGKYLTNANTDDRHRKDALELLARTLDENPDISLVYADCLVTRNENRTFETADVSGCYRWLDFDAKDLLLKGCFCGPQPMWRLEVHTEHGYFDPEMVTAGDYEFWLRLAQNRKFLHVKETLGLYLKSPESVEHQNQASAVKEIRIARERYRQSILEGKGMYRPAIAEPARDRVEEADSLVTA